MKIPLKEIPRSILLKVSKLVLRLESSNEQEVLATVFAIKRVLATSECSFHELAAVINGESGATVYSLSVIEVCEDCLRRLKLEPYESKFLKQLIDNLKLNPRFLLSDKQTSWLMLIAKRLKQEAA